MKDDANETKLGVCCPVCGSSRLYRDGLRYSDCARPIQRLLCRDCGHRFSEWQTSKASRENSANRQVCELLTEESKNLAVTESKTVAGERQSQTQQEIEVKIVQFALALKNKGRTSETRRTYIGSLCTLSNKGANLLDPANVEDVIAKQENWTLRTKRNFVDWYARFAKFLHFEWEKPNYKAPIRIPFLPTEEELGQLISGSPRKVSIALQIAKETAARIGEIVRLKWTDLDLQANLLTFNEPEKGSNSGIYKVSEDLVKRILTLPRTHERIFGKASVDSLINSLLTSKKRLASSFCNVRLAQIHFHSLRHWKLTNYAHAIKDPFQVQLFARHKDMKSTMRYIHLERIIYQVSDKDEWIVKAAKTVDESSELISVGFEYVTDVEGFKLFRKRK